MCECVLPANAVSAAIKGSIFPLKVFAGITLLSWLPEVQTSFALSPERTEIGERKVVLSFFLSVFLSFFPLSFFLSFLLSPHEWML